MSSKFNSTLGGPPQGFYRLPVPGAKGAMVSPANPIRHAWLVVRARFGELPRGVSWLQIYGASLLAGIGFTMSLFVASLAFPDAAIVAASKIAILLSSFLSAFVGVYVIHYSTRTGRQKEAEALNLRAMP